MLGKRVAAFEEVIVITQQSSFKVYELKLASLQADFEDSIARIALFRLTQSDSSRNLKNPFSLASRQLVLVKQSEYS